VRFKDRPSLNGLFAELATTFAVRYEKEPLPGALDIEKTLSDKHRDGEASESLRKYLEELPAHRHKTQTERLQRPGWLVETINDHLRNRSLWPTDDGAVTQLVGTADGTRKRTLDQTRMELQVPRLHKIPKTM
jgi:hypothetical protein